MIHDKTFFRSKVSYLFLLVVGISLINMARADEGKTQDFGAFVQKLLTNKSMKLFGFGEPLSRAANDTDYVPREKATANQRVKLAKGLKATFVARNVASLGDMITFWPNKHKYTHLIVCIEQSRTGTTPGGNGGLNASMQRIEVKTGKVETILHGMSRCDGIRTTPWGTILATEESNDGRGYEVMDPLHTTDHWVADRATGDIRDGIDSTTPSKNIVQRQALPTMAWEGLTVLKSGVVIGGDELRPGTGTLNNKGGAVFKFVPSVVRTNDDKITDLSQSPLVSGSVYAMQVSCVDHSSSRFPQYGQGCEVGEAAWVKVDALNARSDANAKKATGDYRPEDLHSDPKYKREGVRFCWTNTGNEDAKQYAEVICAIDTTPAPTAAADVVDARNGFSYQAVNGTKTYVTANRFVEGDTRFNSFDNLEFNPVNGTWWKTIHLVKSSRVYQTVRIAILNPTVVFLCCPWLIQMQNRPVLFLTARVKLRFYISSTVKIRMRSPTKNQIQSTAELMI